MTDNAGLPCVGIPSMHCSTMATPYDIGRMDKCNANMVKAIGPGRDMKLIMEIEQLWGVSKYACFCHIPSGSG